MFGPVAFSPEGLDLMKNQNGKILGVPDSYIQHYAVVEAIHLHAVTGRWPIGIKKVDVDFIYPPEQKTEEEASTNDAIRAKRSDQLKTLTDAYEKLGRKNRLRKNDR